MTNLNKRFKEAIIESNYCCSVFDYNSYNIEDLQICHILRSKKIKELEEKLYTTKLELSNMVIQKNIAFISNKNYISEIYTNSSKKIEKYYKDIIDDRLYNSNEIFILNEIIKGYNMARYPPIK